MAGRRLSIRVDRRRYPVARQPGACDGRRGFRMTDGAVHPAAPLTLLDKLWNSHVVVVSPHGEDLLYVDFNMINEGGAFLAFDQLRLEGRKARRSMQQMA